MNNIININGRAIERIDYKGQPVISFPMIDELHERPKRTAQRNFQKNKSKFIEGEDFYHLKGEELSQFKVNRARNSCSVIGNQANEAIILTKSGYGMLVKSFNDDLAWQIQRALVNHYFSSQPMVSTERQQPEIKLTIDLGRLAKQADQHLDGKASLRLLNHLTGIPVNDLVHEIEIKEQEAAVAKMQDAEKVSTHLYAILNQGGFRGIETGTTSGGRRYLITTTATLLEAMQKAGKEKGLPPITYSAAKLGNIFHQRRMELEAMGWERTRDKTVSGSRYFKYTCLIVSE